MAQILNSRKVKHFNKIDGEPFIVDPVPLPSSGNNLLCHFDSRFRLSVRPTMGWRRYHESASEVGQKLPEFLGYRILYGNAGSDSKFVQLLGVLIMSTRRFLDVPFALHSSVVFTPLPRRIEGSPVRGQSVLDWPAE